VRRKDAMQKFETFQEAGPDKMLHLAIPVNEANQRYQVTVLVNPADAPASDAAIGPGWPPGFFEQTAGSIEDESFFRHDQGRLEQRLPF
jgi:hypothetical protein